MNASGCISQEVDVAVEMVDLLESTSNGETLFYAQCIKLFARSKSCSHTCMAC